MTAHGFPQFCVSIAYERRGRVEFAVVFDALKRELFVAARGRGARLNARVIHVPRRRRSTGHRWRPAFAAARAATTITPYGAVMCTTSHCSAALLDVAAAVTVRDSQLAALGAIGA